MKFINQDMNIEDGLLEMMAHLPTASFPYLVEAGFWKKLADRDFMRIAVFLAKKSYAEGGCPIGALIIDNQTRAIVGKGHNMLVQENNPYNHGETAAVRDAGRRDFSQTTIFTTLSPCDVCAALIYTRQFSQVVVGDVTNTDGNEDVLREKGIKVDVLEDTQGVELYAKYRQEKPNLDLEDWQGLATVKRD